MRNCPKRKPRKLNESGKLRKEYAKETGFLIAFCFLTALITAVIPFLAYTLGLKHVEASKAGIIATIEPMVATLVGIVIFSEPLTIMSGTGILLILSAVVILNLKRKAQYNKPIKQ